MFLIAALLSLTVGAAALYYLNTSSPQIPAEGTVFKVLRGENLSTIAERLELEGLIRQAIEANPKAVADFAAGKKKALGAMVGFVMKATKGQANPQLVNEMLVKALRG